ncbi:hypothetical protein DBV15_09790 [Temnothorax longispinosus]|uniref:Uncharacterized protein n=1 Tax=Temnothorax longispinosus TaxID=300112 RepID=A0A4S2JRG0_9HYME|nr:hypothetical protein DBV15_09790 [Temnothorax longispinosus]
MAAREKRARVKPVAFVTKHTGMFQRVGYDRYDPRLLEQMYECPESDLSQWHPNKHRLQCMLHNLQASIGSRAIATCACARSPTRSGRVVDDPEDVLTDRSVRPNKERLPKSSFVNVFGQHD